MRKIEFISYTGKWPTLCRGVLTLSVDGVFQSFDSPLISAGSIWRTDREIAYYTTGPWTLDIEPGFTETELEYITKLVNENVELGCCMGCL